MRKKKNRKFIRGNIIVPLLVIVVIIFGVLMTSGNLLYNKTATDPNEKYDEAEFVEEAGKKNLQLKDVSFKTQPTPQDSACNHDNGVPINSGEPYDPESEGACKCPQFVVECAQKRCTQVIAKDNVPQTPGPDGRPCDVAPYNQEQYDSWCQSSCPVGSIPSCLTSGDGIYCLGKPVIYLYPEKPMMVDVQVLTQGKVVISDPQIEKSNSWTNVMAHPSGLLVYKDYIYRELFYETESNKINEPASGIVIKTENLEQELRKFVIKLGLSRTDEQDEFLDWWLPRLKALNSPYVFVSILDREEKDRLDKVEISPKPETFIDFIVYFRPIDEREASSAYFEPLKLPPTPQRKGFTAVEWGGVIGR